MAIIILMVPESTIVAFVHRSKPKMMLRLYLMQIYVERANHDVGVFQTQYCVF